jgi:hypothetical protein
MCCFVGLCVCVICMFIKTVFLNTAHTLCWEVLFHMLLSFFIRSL